MYYLHIFHSKDRQSEIKPLFVFASLVIFIFPLYTQSHQITPLIQNPRNRIGSKSVESMALSSSPALTLTLTLTLAVTVCLVGGNSEGDTLYTLRRSLSDPDNVLESWDPTLVNPCTWFHVTCNQDNRVTRVYLLLLHTAVFFLSSSFSFKLCLLLTTCGK